MKNQKGFTLIELIAASFILTIGIVGAYAIFADIIKTTSMLSSRLTAAYLAQEGIEIFRNMRDANWLQGKNWGASIDSCLLGCEADYKLGTPDEDEGLMAYGDNGDFLNVDSDNFYSYSNGTATSFKRKITVTYESSYTLKVVSSVFWSSRGENYQLEAEEYLYDWR